MGYPNPGETMESEDVENVPPAVAESEASLPEVDEVQIRARLEAGKAWYSSQVQASLDDLEFMSGETQWDDAARANRTYEEGSCRPMLKTHVLRPLVNRVLNPIRMYPYGIKVSTARMSAEQDPDGLVKQAQQVVAGVVRGVERRSRSSDAFERCAEHLVIGGLGYVHVCAEYEREDGWDLEVKIEQVDDISTVVFDPYSVKEDGSDAKWAAIIKAVPEEEGREDHNPGAQMANIWESWFQVPAGSVWEMVYYEAFEERSQMVNPLTGAIRQSQKTQWRASKFVGGYLRESVVLPIRYCPIIPGKGERIYSSVRQLAGMVYWGRDLIQLSNYYLSQEAEVAGHAPRASWVMAEGQDEGHPEWEESNIRPVAALKYVPITYANGAPVPAPFRAQTSADTSGMRSSLQGVVADLSRVEGLPDNVMGMVEAGAESGRAVAARSANGELATAHYADNLAKTVAQVGRVVIDFIRYAYKGEREVEIVDERGESTLRTVDVGAMMDALGRIEVDADAGPSYASARREANGMLLELGRIAPDKLPLMMDIIAGNSDAPGADVISKRFASQLPPEMRDAEPGVPTGEAKMALDAADQTIQQQQAMIEELKAYLSQMQASIIDNAKDRQTDVLIASQNNEVKILLEQMKQQGMNQRNVADLIAKQGERLDRIAADLTGKIMTSSNEGVGYRLNDIAPMAPGPVDAQVEGVGDTLALIQDAVGQGADPGTMGQ
jgi:hypothetical protein